MLEKIGIGIDIIDITRFKEKPFETNRDFYKKIFHDSEIKYCLKHANSSQSFAAKFAIKESVIKSINNQINFLDILTGHLDSKPTVTLLNDNSYNFLVSVSHEKLHAIAVVISEKLS
ncbi:4'-phosphopantetheinyl transferase [Candidatus Nitrosarchaeum limnium SFB1]|jgi:holo-[acyl-carrier protein] synthase|uniref:4'-phosphopantetheinyl transferase n=1 Tax=Candidatus Nitrosarchaeum limnium SFB1 TaxID=886738 RepID=F3KMY6_9ARCH|nr:4'-phosphopantetheinyl transferase [Candidatus Nitrosarchaeum limnium SFB1]